MNFRAKNFSWAEVFLFAEKIFLLERGSSQLYKIQGLN